MLLYKRVRRRFSAVDIHQLAHTDEVSAHTNTGVCTFPSRECPLSTSQQQLNRCNSSADPMHVNGFAESILVQEMAVALRRCVCSPAK
jgi:hypothetical protein